MSQSQVPNNNKEIHPNPVKPVSVLQFARMIHLLFTIVLAEMALILTLLFRTPIRKLVITVLDKLKQGKGPLVTKTVAVTMLVVFSSSLYSIFKIQQRSMDAGMVNPTDEVLKVHSILEASLMGFLLFLAIMVDRLHYYIRELSLLRKNSEAANKLIQKYDKRVSGEDHKERKDEWNWDINPEEMSEKLGEVFSR
ncbi:B-cell receptor-associated 31-like [Quillaja saponaria]|uniref:Endoplasmic reticulum transmembrane protein n=1 Tax=Quillaja saponaria TaxID=32244 RepID=A0AAD7LMT8_QUISA|nr:B-cell receptor-associated 31-like [Quillaja saponaria]